MYRIYCENKFEWRIRNLLIAMTEGWTMSNAIGYHWKNGSDNTIVIDLVDVEEEHAFVIAKKIKSIQGCDSVLVVTIPATYKLV